MGTKSIVFATAMMAAPPANAASDACFQASLVFGKLAHAALFCNMPDLRVPTLSAIGEMGEERGTAGFRREDFAHFADRLAEETGINVSSLNQRR